MAFAVVVLVSSCLAANAQQERRALCPTVKYKGCEITVDPKGNPRKPVMCPVSLCQADPPWVVDGKKVCTFSCPEFYVP